jgi:MFS family permease
MADANEIRPCAAPGWFAGSTAETLAQALKKARWRLGFLLALMFAASILDRSNVGFAKDALRLDAHIGDRAFALGAGIFFIGYALFEIPSNLILYRVGARVWLSRIMITWGIASATMMFVHGSVSFYVLRFVVGVAEAGFSPGVVLYSTYWFPSKERGKFLGIYYMGLPAALTLGSALSGLLMEKMNGYRGLHNWQWLFLIEGLAASLIGLLTYFVLPARPSQARWLDASQKIALEEAIANEEALKHSPRGSIAALRDHRVLRLVAIYFAIQAGIYGVVFYLPSRIAVIAGTQIDSRAGLLTAIPWVCAFLSLRPVTGWADRVCEHRRFAIAMLLLAAVGLVASTRVTALYASLIAFSLAAIGLVVVQPIFWTLPTDYLRGTAAATGIAMIGALGNLGGFVAPTLKEVADKMLPFKQGGNLVLAGLTLCGVALLVEYGVRFGRGQRRLVLETAEHG